MYDIVYGIIYDIIQCIMMSTITFHALQHPILPRHSVRMQLTTIMNLANQWISTRSVTLLIKALYMEDADQGPLTNMYMKEDK